ncbi:MAG: hypothetical protein DRP88_05200 [Candidatus Neomarinimicrobiota bacterium]|nr:MAG: hypothetical protein DRP88_05200 [Candidatus Neomarinimicrobiota bacterium]
MKKLISLALFVVVVSVVLLGAEQEKRDTLKIYPFPEITVTASRVKYPSTEIPFSITIEDIEKIAFKSSMRLYDMVNTLPGVFITSRTNMGYGVGRGSGGSMSIRGVGGFPTTRSLILIDGRPDVMGIFGHPINDVYFLTNTKAIEVIKGPASLLYGSNALAGVVNVVLKHEYKNGLHLSLPVLYGSFNTISAAMENTFERNGMGYNLTFGRRKSEGFRKLNNTGNDSYKSDFCNFEFHANLREKTRVVANLYKNDMYLYDPGQVDNPRYDNWYDIRRAGFDVTGTFKAKRTSSELKVHYNSGKHKIWDGWKSEDYTAGVMLTESFTFKSGSNLIVGYDYRKYGGKVLQPMKVERNVVENSVFAVCHLKLLNKIAIDAGTRFVTGDVVKDMVIPAMGMVYNVSNCFSLKAYYSKGYRNPTVSELYLFGSANSNLKPEYSNNCEFSSELRLGYLKATVTAFKVKVSDMIQTVNFKNINVGNFESKGIETSLIYIIPGGHLYLGGYFADYSNRIAGSPDKKINLGFLYHIKPTITANVSGEYVAGLISYKDPYAYGPPVYVELDPYFVLNGKLSFTLVKNLEILFAVNNIFDTNYETMYGFPMPGRNFQVGLKLAY